MAHAHADVWAVTFKVTPLGERSIAIRAGEFHIALSYTEAEKLARELTDVLASQREVTA